MQNPPKARELMILDIYGREDENRAKTRGLFKNTLKKIRYQFFSPPWQRIELYSVERVKDSLCTAEGVLLC